MPTESEKIVPKGVAKMQMLESLGLKNIQIRLIPATELYEYYLSEKKDEYFSVKVIGE